MANVQTLDFRDVDPKMPMHLIRDSDTLRIDFWPCGVPTEKVAVTFTYFGAPGEIKLDGPGYRGEMLQREGFDIIAFKSSINDWFQLVDDADLEIAAEIAGHYDLRVGYGSSMGGFAAIVFAKKLSLNRVVALSPQFEIDGRWDLRWEREASQTTFRHRISPAVSSLNCQYIILFDPHHLDKEHAKLISQSLGKVKTDLVAYPFGGHPVTVPLHESGLLKQSVLQAIETGETEQFRIARREGRRKSKTYFRHLARHLGKKKRFTLADLMFRQSYVLDPSDEGLRKEWKYVLEIAACHGYHSVEGIPISSNY